MRKEEDRELEEENTEAYVNVKGEVNKRTHTFTIFTNSRVDDLYKKKPSTARIKSAQVTKRPISSRQPLGVAKPPLP